MARRKGKPGDYLITDDYTGWTTYASRVQTDYWGNVGKNVLKRNLQEISSPLGDPYPVDLYRGPQYETTNACDFETLPLFVGKTSRPFPTNAAYAQLQIWNPGIGDAEIGCTFIVR